MRAYFHTFEGERVTLESHAELEEFLEQDQKAAKKSAAATKRKRKADGHGSDSGEAAPPAG
jgi:hypothetical protein